LLLGGFFIAALFALFEVLEGVEQFLLLEPLQELHAEARTGECPALRWSSPWPSGSVKNRLDAWST